MEECLCTYKVYTEILSHIENYKLQRGILTRSLEQVASLLEKLQFFL